MGAVLSVVQQTELQHIEHLWMKSMHFRVAIVMMVFLIARRIYNKLHRMYYNLPLNGPTGLPCIGCIPYLLLNTYTFMTKMSKYGDITAYNIGLQTIISINSAQIANKLFKNTEISDMNWTKHQKYIQQLITQQINNKYIAKCIDKAVEKQRYNDNGKNMNQYIQWIVLNIMMMICFDITMNAEFYDQWISKNNQSLQPSHSAIYVLIAALIGYNDNNEQNEYTENIFIDYIKHNIINKEDVMMNTECIYYKITQNDNNHETDVVISDILVIMKYIMNSISNSLQICIDNLCKYPMIQNEIYSQITTTSDDVQQISILNAFIFESLRLEFMSETTSYSMPQIRRNRSDKPIQIELENGTIYKIAINGLYHINISDDLKSLQSIDLDHWFDENDNVMMNESIYIKQQSFHIELLKVVLSSLISRYSFEFKGEINKSLITEMIVGERGEYDEEMIEIELPQKDIIPFKEKRGIFIENHIKFNTITSITTVTFFMDTESSPSQKITDSLLSVSSSLPSVHSIQSKLSNNSCLHRSPAVRAYLSSLRSIPNAFLLDDIIITASIQDDDQRNERKYEEYKEYENNDGEIDMIEMKEMERNEENEENEKNDIKIESEYK